MGRISEDSSYNSKLLISTGLAINHIRHNIFLKPPPPLLDWNEPFDDNYGIGHSGGGIIQRRQRQRKGTSEATVAVSARLETN